MEFFTRMKNVLLDELARTDLSPVQFRIVLVVCRLTFGYNKHEAAISTTTIQARTGLDPRTIRRRLKELEERHILYQVVQGTRTRIIGINNRIEEWLRDDSLGADAPKTEGQAPLSAEGQAPPTLKKEKESINNITITAADNTPEIKVVNEVESYYMEKRGRTPPASLQDIASIVRVLKEGLPVPFLKTVIDKAFDEYKPAHPSDSIYAFRYIEPKAIQSWLVHNKKLEGGVDGGEFKGYTRGSSGPGKVIGTGAFFPTSSKWDRAAVESV